MYSTVYFRNKTTADLPLNETSLDDVDASSFIADASSPSTDKDDSSGSSLAPTTSIRLLLKWYSLIAILSVLVVSGILFAVCRLSLKAEAFRNTGLSSHQDSLLFSDCKASSSVPIPIDLDESNDL